MLYPEFNQYRSEQGAYKGLVNCYLSHNGHLFYVDASFHAALENYSIKRKEDYDRLLQRIYEIIEEKPVFLTGNFEGIEVFLDGYTYVDIDDVANSLKILLRDDNRPSDYGD